MTNRYELEDEMREEGWELDISRFHADFNNRLRHWDRTGEWPDLPERELEELPL